ncbi:hypothetical protein DEJ32_08575 [Curtobacterium sp. MCPF17_046]|nr:hypothetical protein DEJ32_08575 [Curtobacterium sp. MCPF17_046]PYY46541.1 hypothetical protein DEI84_12650 [Curtobacterium sp. MCBD17_023]
MSKAKAWVLFLVWAFAIVFASAFLLAGSAVFQSCDVAHRVRLSCFISSAEAVRGSTRSASGVGASVPQELIEQGGCGRFVLREGVTVDNRGDIASASRPERSTFLMPVAAPSR